MTGSGVWAQLLRQRFHKACARLDLQRERRALDLSLFRAPEDGGSAAPSAAAPQQGSLF
jgi:hypothetical protein